MKVSDKLKGISRRDLLRLTKHFGVTSTLLAAGGLTGAVSFSRLAEAANSTYEKRFKTPAKHKLKFGAAGFNERNLLIERAGVLQFINDLEERTEGEIRVEFIGNNQICGQLNCVKKTQQGIVDFYAASTQNSAGGAPYLNVLDYAYHVPVPGVPISLPVSSRQPESAARPDAQEAQYRIPVQPCRTARHHAGPEMEGQAAGHERHPTRRAAKTGLRAPSLAVLP